MKDVYTLDDLRNAKADPDNIFFREEKPARLAVIGDPIAHSKSPQLHQPALDALDLNCTYIRVYLAAEEFDEGVNLMKNLGFIGCNVTVPHKEKALEGTRYPDAFARSVGVANTLLFKDGSCYSTDPVGLESALEQIFHLDLQKTRVAVFGAGGGAGSAVSLHFSQLNVKTLMMCNRSEEKLTKAVFPILEAGEYSKTCLSWFFGGDVPMAEDIDLIINATSLGLSPNQPSPIPSEILRPYHLVYDMTYGCENALSKACEEVGAVYTDGLSMLRHQGAEAFKIWFPGTDPLPLMGLQ